MGQDIRELLKNDRLFDVSQMEEMSSNHELRFLDKLNENFPEKRSSKVVTLPKRKMYYSIAASVVVTLALGSFFFLNSVQHTSNEIVYNLSKNNKEVLPSLADVSPEFKEVEDYYLASINVELANLKVTDGNREVVGSFMKQLSRLDDEYKVLQREFHTEGANTFAIEALIDNLQMRLELLQQLKQNLNTIDAKNPDTYQNLQV